MPANKNIVGVVYNINTTGFITSAPLVVKGWLLTRYSTGAATISAGAVVLDRTTKSVPLIGAKIGSGQSLYVPVDTHWRGGLTCTSLVAGSTVRIYLK